MYLKGEPATFRFEKEILKEIDEQSENDDNYRHGFIKNAIDTYLELMASQKEAESKITKELKKIKASLIDYVEIAEN